MQRADGERLRLSLLPRKPIAAHQVKGHVYDVERTAAGQVRWVNFFLEYRLQGLPVTFHEFDAGR
jgi:hypothetical protein